MSSSYKILALLALVLIVGIASYHWLQSNHHHDLAIPVVAPSSQTHGLDTTKNPAIASDLPSKPGIGDLMTRIHSHMDQANRAQSQSPVETTVQEQVMVASPQAQPDTTRLESVSVTEIKAPPKTPTVTFDQLPHTTVQSAPRTRSDPISTNTNFADPATTSAPPVTPPIVQAPSQPQSYTVQPGDTFSTIAVKIYGSQNHWIDIATANPFVDPKRLQIGQTIRLPDPDDILGTDDESTMQDAGQMVTHVVRPGDSLSSIANRYYNNPDQWRVIFDTNRDRIGQDPDRLRAGEILRIPPQHMPAQ